MIAQAAGFASALSSSASYPRGGPTAFLACSTRGFYTSDRPAAHRWWFWAPTCGGSARNGIPAIEPLTYLAVYYHGYIRSTVLFVVYYRYSFSCRTVHFRYQRTGPAWTKAVQVENSSGNLFKHVLFCFIRRSQWGTGHPYVGSFPLAAKKGSFT